jgi:hypothetical protein
VDQAVATATTDEEDCEGRCEDDYAEKWDDDPRDRRAAQEAVVVVT